jgi:2-methylcitrate dehydratase PrpD
MKRGGFEMSSKKIAEFIAHETYERIPQEAIDIAKMCIVDGIGVALAGSLESAGKIITEYVKDSGCNPQSGVIGGGLKTSPSLAALANGTLAHALDFDDHSITWTGHPTIVLLPSLFALAERDNLNGKRILEAYSIGWEVGSKLCTGVSNSLFEQGWHPTATAGTLGATVACAKLLGLNVDQILMALGIAASEASGLRYNFGTDTKPLHAGMAARNAVTAVLLAQKGFTAGKNVLEDPLGFSSVFAKTMYDLDGMAEKLGNPYDIMVSYIIKPYPSCGLTHRCIDAMLELVKEHKFGPEQVDRIECHTPPMAPEILIYPRPQSGLEGKFSMEYCMAAAIIDGEVSLRQFTDEKVCAVEAQDLLSKVELKVRDVPKGGSLLKVHQPVKVKLRGGSELVREVEWPKGYPYNPMTWDEVAAKFKDCAEGALSQTKIDQSIEMLSNMETLDSISGLMRIVCNIDS